MNRKKLFLAFLVCVIAFGALWMRFRGTNTKSNNNEYASNRVETADLSSQFHFGARSNPNSNIIVLIPQELVGLSSNDFQAVVLAAERSNNVTAAVDLADYYGYAVNDVTNHIKYLRIAASRGHVISQYNLGFIYANYDEFKNLNEAKYWLEIAASNGSSYAKQQLELIGHK